MLFNTAYAKCDPGVNVSSYGTEFDVLETQNGDELQPNFCDVYYFITGYSLFEAHPFDDFFEVFDFTG